MGFIYSPSAVASLIGEVMAEGFSPPVIIVRVPAAAVWQQYGQMWTFCFTGRAVFLWYGWAKTGEGA